MSLNNGKKLKLCKINKKFINNILSVIVNWEIFEIKIINKYF